MTEHDLHTERPDTEHLDIEHPDIERPAAAPAEDSARPDELPDDLADLTVEDLPEDLPEDELAEDDLLDGALEALLLVIDEPLDESVLASALAQPTERVETALRRLADDYRARERGIDLRKVGAGWRFYTRDRYAGYVERLLKDGQRAKLTRAALETLAVVAYRQPVTRARVSAVRGVNVDGVMRTLLTRGLVEEFGVDPQTQGILYRTSELFLERLGLSSLAELPPLAPLLPEVDSIDDV
ncbi:MAG TPA: SMC-Scp complex subunit ScpB [Pseudonocardia sp.]|nr:SMC-Scp complex subunit ScpB [Pseudonocardia sp.]